MSTEQTPLVGDQLHHDVDSSHYALPTEEIYDRFNTTQKRVILVIVSLTELVPMFVAGCFIPSIPQISEDIHSTPAAVSSGVGLTVFANALGILLWSTYASFYGRRAMYLCGMPLTAIASFAVAACTDLNGLLFWRFVQTFGCSGGYSLGAATIGDIYKVEERGTAMGIFFGTMLLGPGIAPFIGGAVTQFWSWRSFHVILGVWSVIQFLLLVFFLPETAHPGSRGIDKVRGPRRLFVLINPFRCLAFLRSPNILALAVANTFALSSDYVLSVPIAFTIGAKYGIVSEGLIGALFLPNGFGKFVGALISGRVSDVVVRQTRRMRKGVWIPEDRLRAVWLGVLVLIPISVILAGFTTEYIGGTVGLVINLVCLFANGMGIYLALTPIGAYTADVMPSRSAEVLAAITAFRSALLAPVSGLLIPAVETIGVVATNGISGILSLVGYLLIWLTIQYGAQMRAYVDVGYPEFLTQAPNREDAAVED